jgi:hypothetical protein
MNRITRPGPIPIDVEYDRGVKADGTPKRVIKRFEDEHSAKTFYIRKYKAGKHPSIRSKFHFPQLGM